MSFDSRIPLINEIEQIRGSKIISYLISLRPNLGSVMAEDAVREMFDHLLLLPERPIPKLDIFLCSNGGNGTVPWRMVSLFREYTDHLSVLIPYRAYSAATMLALGADEIIMTPFAEMGPIDPTVSNEYNPIDSQTQQRVGISVEDVKAYIAFVKETVGIRHEDELVKAVEILAQKVHPLALGNVERFIAQSRLITRKIMMTYVKKNKTEHEIEEIIETLASKLYFHGHPINRKEAKEELGLSVTENPSSVLENLMWKLYLDYEDELDNKIPFDPLADILANSPDPIVQPGQMAVIPPGLFSKVKTKSAIVESARLSCVHEMNRRIVVANFGPGGEPSVRAEVLSQGWYQTRAP